MTETPQSTVLHYQKERTAPVGIAVSMFKGGKLPEVSPQEMESLRRIEEDFPDLKSLPDNKSKREFIAKKHGELMRQLASEERDLKKKQQHLQSLREHSDKVDEILTWAATAPKIEKPDGTAFRALRKAVAEGRTIYFDKDLYAETPAHDFEKEVFRHAEILVIEHDWAGAFENANVDDAVIRLPYDVCAFDFKFSGHRVIALATQLDTDIAFTPAIQVGDSWALFGFVVPASGRMKAKNDDERILDLIDAIAAQIRAACIALDAEVARSETVREPYSGTHGKNSHQMPRSYHVVSLARRARPLPSSPNETGRRVRLHFRRGHWRHFEDHKTWIKWMLVGDADLGFVDKEYRL